MTLDNSKHSDPKQPNELALYFEYAIALMRPGSRVRRFNTVRNKAAETGDLSHCNDENLKLIIEEGRRKLDQQSDRFDRIRQTAQVILPIGVALLVVVGSELSHIKTEHRNWLRGCLYGGWGISTTLVLSGVFGAAAILVVKATFGTVLPTLVSQLEPDRLSREVAEAYVSESVVGEDTINTRITIQWWSAFFLATGGILYGIIWAVRVL